MMSRVTDTPYRLVDSAEMLDTFCASLKGEKWLALDTEFIREKTYYPKLCLLQVGVPGNIACIDPLALPDLSPLLDILYDRNIVKVLHSCSQDMEIFACLKGEIPGPVFDTQLAAPLIGLPEQIGYANLVQEMAGVTLDKSQTRTDWSRRPLATAQLAYAADDVRYLAEIYPAFRQKLADMGRLEWLDAEFLACEQIDRYLRKPELAWQRIRGVDKLRPRPLSVLQALSAWREQVARDKNLPRNWILKDDTLSDIARMAPTTRDKLASVRNLPPKSLERYGSTILDIVKAAVDTAPQPLPEHRRRVKPTAHEDALADILQAQLRVLAARYEINSTSLGSRKDLLALVQGDEAIPLMHGWRREMAGNELLAMRDGQRLISVNNKQIIISRTE